MMSPTVNVRLARPSDAEAIVRVIQKAYDQYRGRVEPPLQALSVGADNVAGEIRVPGKGYIVAVVGGQIVGSLRYRRIRMSGRRVLELSRLAVDPEFRHLGIGTTLMRQGETLALRAGIKHLRGNVRATMPALVDYYGRMGWRVLGRRSKPGYPRYLLVVGKEVAPEKEGEAV